MTNLLEVRGLTKVFGGVKAVNGVDIDLAAGELLALIGPNGAGKSTCFNMVGGQLTPDRGSIHLLGKDITGWPPRRISRLGVGRTFQITATFASMTVIENIQMALLSYRRLTSSLRGRASQMLVDEARSLLDDVGIAEHANRACSVLAYGDLKRVELAIAMANAPKLLLMDEPTAGMAPRERLELMAMTARLCKQRGIGVLFTEHDMDVVFNHSDRITVLARGELIATGSPAEVRADRMVREIYLGSDHG
ncbi:MAG: ABC transporter ATP-binding protein [Geminicoccaceae bacterium]|nr:ABC transporter ATP-binding protein [Geminicoccaceae bacterium]